MALADLIRAAELFQPTFRRTDDVDGWVSLEVSPRLAHDTDRTLAAARHLHQRGSKPNLFIKIPGTAEGLPAIEAAVFAGVPVNVTLLFSREQYVARADAYLRGIERRIEAGSTLPSHPSPRSLSAAETLRSVARSRASSTIGWASRSQSAPTGRIESCLLRRVSSALSTPAHVPSGFSGPAPAPRTRPRPTPST